MGWKFPLPQWGPSGSLPSCALQGEPPPAKRNPRTNARDDEQTHVMIHSIAATHASFLGPTSTPGSSEAARRQRLRRHNPGNPARFDAFDLEMTIVTVKRPALCNNQGIGVEGAEHECRCFLHNPMQR